MTPKVSVIVPTYNCDRYVAQAVESVLARTKTVAIYKVKNICLTYSPPTKGIWANILANLGLYSRQVYR